MSAAAPPLSPDPGVLAAYGLAEAEVRVCGHGLINRTWILREPSGRSTVLQAVNPIFAPAIHEDIEVVTRHLESHGLATPRLLRTQAGALYVEAAGRVWRLLTFIDGITRDAASGARDIEQAGAMLARFHRALGDLEHEFENARLGVHDTSRHLAALRAALEAHPAHRMRDSVAPLAARVLEAADRLAPLPAAPDRIVHGDPKISNVMFARGSGEALCMIDLDTLARMPLAIELGDACRSWCNPWPEDASEAEFSLSLFAAAMRGYAAAARGWIEPAEWRAIGAATLTVTLELAARFCADALNESYFAWDPMRYSSASEHNLARTRSQLALAESQLAQRSAIEQTLAAEFGPDT